MDMNGLSGGGYLQSIMEGYQKKEVNKEDKEKAAKGCKDKGLNEVEGRTIGNPKLSDKALKYYEQLKKKFSNMDFILVSPEMKEEAERNKGMYTSSKALLVLIDSDKIERMAVDEEYRKKYEGILAGATSQIEQMKTSLGSNADKVSSFGMTFDDHGNASYFAVVDRALELQRERIAEKKEENIKERKQEAKAAEEKQAEQRAEEKRLQKQDADEVSVRDSKGKTTVTAGSWEELLKKIDELIFADMADNTRTEAELMVGQNFDFSI